MKNTLRKITVLTILIALGFVMVPSIQISADTSFGRVTLSDSAPEATGVTYTVQFEFQDEATEVTLTFDQEFLDNNGVIDVTNEGDCTNTSPSNIITCTASYAGQTAHTLTFTGMTNPEKTTPVEVGVADTYTIQLENTTSGEWGNAMFAIIEPVVVTARVSAALAFTVEGVEDTETLHGGGIDISTQPDAIDFGTLDINTAYIAAQDLSITTNASDGYSVTVWQDQDLRSPGGDTIKAFQDGTPIAPASSIAWAAPGGDLGDPDTWGHFGFTSQDRQVGATCLDVTSEAGYFFGGGWAGFNGDTPEEVMCHTGPSDGEAEHIGTTRVGYQIEITALQPAGDYTNTLTYIATPTF